MNVNTILLSDFTDPRFCAAFRAYFAELDIHVSDWEGLFREINEEGNNLAHFMLDDGGEAIGFIQFQFTSFSNWFFVEPFAFIREFWIAPAHRRQGYGKRLLRLAEAYFVERGACRAILTADDAALFYLTNGYEKAPGIKSKNEMDVFVKKLS